MENKIQLFEKLKDKNVQIAGLEPKTFAQIPLTITSTPSTTMNDNIYNAIYIP